MERSSTRPGGCDTRDPTFTTSACSERVQGTGLGHPFLSWQIVRFEFTHCGQEDSGEEEGRFGLYGATDMRFVVYHSLLVVAVFSAALYSGLTGRVSLRTGLDYEIYVCVMVEVLVSTTVSAVFKKVGLLKALMMVAPFSARFDLLRDATIVAVFIQVGNEQSSIWPLLAAAVVPLMNLLSFLVVLEDRADFVELRDSFWAKTAAPRPWLKEIIRLWKG
eukprot:g16574.t1